MSLIGLGMTEHDTLRSNQIRFGLIERQDALEKVNHDISNALGLASYFATVGIDLKWAGGTYKDLQVTTNKIPLSVI